MIEPISISHDAADPVAYKIKNEEKTAAVVTDLGTYDENMIDKIKNLDVLLLEANHDVHMLQVGSYPYPLKQRILGKKDISLTNCPVSFWEKCSMTISTTVI